MNVNKALPLEEVYAALHKEDVVRLDAADLRFMQKLGFSQTFIRLAEKFGNFRSENLEINWSLSWKNDSDFFFEITRNAFPIGRLENAGFLYCLNIGAEESRVAIVSEDRKAITIIAESIYDFLVDKFSSLRPNSSKPPSPITQVESNGKYRIDLNTCDSGVPVSLWPFGKQTADIFTGEVGVFEAEKLSPNDAKRLYKVKNIKWCLGAFIFFSILFFVLRLLNAPTSTTVALLIVSLLFLPALSITFGRIGGRRQRL